MKKGLIIFYCAIIAFAFFSSAYADNNTKTSYGSEISKLITCYENRLFLIHSEYKILSDIGRDAQVRIDYLKSQKEFLVLEMKAHKVELIPGKIKSFAVQRVHRAGIGLAYSPHQ